jgi:hypothetical protein
MVSDLLIIELVYLNYLARSKIRFAETVGTGEEPRFFRADPVVSGNKKLRNRLDNPRKAQAVFPPETHRIRNGVFHTFPVEKYERNSTTSSRKNPRNLKESCVKMVIFGRNNCGNSSDMLGNITEKYHFPQQY